MLFSSKKKLQRDRDAGLVFRWRGGYGTNRGGSTIAFILTAMAFTAAFVMMNVDAKSSTVPSRYRAEMIQLGEMNEDLEWWVERNSPDLPMWSDSKDELREGEVSEELSAAMHVAHNDSYKYEDVEMKQIEIGDEELYALSMRSLPSVKRLSEKGTDVSKALAPVEWKLSVVADGGLETRLPKGLEYGGWMPERWRGLSAKFIIAVDVRGSVISVDPVEWSEDEVVRALEDWIYTISFKPMVKDGAVTATGIIDVEYLPVLKPLDKEAKP